MNLEQQLFYLNKNYHILGVEQEFIVHPAALGIIPMSQASLQCSFTCEFHIDEYHLYLDRLILCPTEVEEKEFYFKDCTIGYNGTILLGMNQIKEYYMNGKLAYFSYQNVLELVFKEGILITTVDQSKAMQRIRKNIELGLRSLTKGRDLRCIKRFIHSSLIGDYKAFLLSYRRMRYIQDMNNNYITIIDKSQVS